MGEEDDRRRFETLVLPHLDAAYNLARWLTRNDHDAQDVVQESMVRAMRYIAGLRGEQARGWLLQIVRHSCYSWLTQNRPAEQLYLDDTLDPAFEIAAPSADEPHAVAVRQADRRALNEAISALPVAYREVLVLRELEDLSYGEIAHIADIPVGTVMSRLSRARGLMRTALAPSTRPALRAVPKSTQGAGKS